MWRAERAARRSAFDSNGVASEVWLDSGPEWCRNAGAPGSGSVLCFGMDIGMRHVFIYGRPLQPERGPIVDGVHVGNTMSSFM